MRVRVDRDVLVRLGRVRAGFIGLRRALHGQRQAVVPQARQELVLVEPEAELGELHPSGWNGHRSVCLRLHRGVSLRLHLGLGLGLRLRLGLRLEWKRLKARHGLLTEHWHLRRWLKHLFRRCGRRKTRRTQVIRRDVG